MLNLNIISIKKQISQYVAIYKEFYNPVFFFQGTEKKGKDQQSEPSKKLKKYFKCIECFWE